MDITILQININGANYYKALTTFLTHTDFDILCLQEVAGLNTFTGNLYSTRDAFEGIKLLLSKNYNGELAISQRFTSDKMHSFVGNAIFYKKEFLLKKKEVVSLYENALYFPSDSKEYEEIGRNVLSLELEKEGKKLTILTTHLAWNPRPTEHLYQRTQNMRLVSYVKKLSHPFILAGDFNLLSSQSTPKELEQYARSLTKIHHIKNTLDSLNHRVSKLFPPGLAVDYIYITKDITELHFSVLEKYHISDHFALSATLRI